MLIATFFLLHCWILLSPCSGAVVPLSMSEKAIDDMYSGCNTSMKAILSVDPYARELTRLPWSLFRSCSEEKFNQRDPEDMALTKDHMQAICTYTGYSGYNEINNDIREGRETYGRTFKYHNLHFFLTSAIQILNSNQGCQTCYRRTHSQFSGEVNQTVRLGSFASASQDSNQTRFGHETCFKINTCSGAFLKKYSNHDEEEEVLIPPYEVFTISERLVPPITVKGLEDCNVVYILAHNRTESNLNCKLWPRKTCYG